MGNKTHPSGVRLGVIREWDTRWFAAKGVGYRAFVKEDLKIRQTIQSRFEDAGISRIEIERGSSDLIVTIHTSRPGIVIGRGGQRVEELRKDIEEVSGARARLNVQEIRQPELDAYLVARSIADQLERRIAFRRAMRQAVGRSMQAGASASRLMFVRDAVEAGDLLAEIVRKGDLVLIKASRGVALEQVIDTLRLSFASLEP